MKYYLLALAGALAVGAGAYLDYQVSQSREPASRGHIKYHQTEDTQDTQGDTVDSGGGNCSPLITMLNNPPDEPLLCVFPQDGFSDTIDYDPVAGTVTTTTGNPPVQQVFSGVTVTTGLDPYGTNGLTFVAFGDVSLFHVRLAAPDGNFLATWDGAPGAVRGIIDAGSCVIPNNGNCGGGGNPGDGEGDDHSCKDKNHQKFPPHSHHYHHHKQRRNHDQD